MDKFTTLEGVAAPLKMINVDTDMIIPKQYLKTIKRTGLGKGLFAEKRSTSSPIARPEFWSPTIISVAAPRVSTRRGR
jgi:3-isopropylmalate/(R)-2-methylmalate dehydratase small subunit